MMPKYVITEKILSYTAEVAELIGSIKVTAELDKNPVLRRKNRIQTIHGSLAIEQNTLSVEQVTAVINGKAVIAPPKDIEEVKNAFEIYELLDTLNPYSADDLLKAHGVMMRGLVSGAGYFRQKPVGVVDSKSGEVIHIGTLPAYVPETVDNLMKWTENSSLHPLVKSCIFHYEFELIHPFLDGNGRCGRLWHTLILSKWNPLFAWLPIESMIHRFQDEYYSVINRCNEKCDSTAFIEFMLGIIKLVLTETVETAQKVAIENEEVAVESEKVAIEQRIAAMKGRTKNNFQCIFNAYGTDGIFGRNDISKLCGVSYAAAGKIIVKLKENELIKDIKGAGKGKYKFGYANKFDDGQMVRLKKKAKEGKLMLDE